MKIYNLNRIQKLPVSREEAWNFFSDPQNLKTMTPEYMGFDIISGAERQMYPGQIIQYYVKPVLGIKIKWVTEITHVVPRQYFVDEQRYGPYAMWHHKHFFREIENGVEVKDVVDYKLPLGPLGQMMHPMIVRPKLEEIFDFRQKKLVELFGVYKDSEESAGEIKD